MRKMRLVQSVASDFDYQYSMHIEYADGTRSKISLAFQDTEMQYAMDSIVAVINAELVKNGHEKLTDVEIEQLVMLQSSL